MFPWWWFVLRLVVGVVSLLFIWLHNFLANLGLFLYLVLRLLVCSGGCFVFIDVFYGGVPLVCDLCVGIVKFHAGRFWGGFDCIVILVGLFCGLVVVWVL